MKEEVRQYPNHNWTNEQKDTDDFGKDIGYMIKGDWLDSGMYSSRLKHFYENEAMVNNEIDEAYYMKKLNLQAEDKCLFDTFSPIPMCQKFVEVVTGGFAIDLFRPLANGVDEISRGNKDKYERDIKVQMFSKDLVLAYSKASGIDFTSDKKLPDSVEELNIDMQINYKSQIEIAAELAIGNVFTLNNFPIIGHKNVRDLLVHGLSPVRCSVDPELGIKYEYVSPKDFVYSKYANDMEDLRDSDYFGEVTTMTVPQIRKMSKNKFTDDDYEKMASNRIETINHTYLNDYEKTITVDVIKYAFKTTHTEVYKQRANGNLIKKPDTWELNPNSKSEVFRNDYDVWYEGYYIPGICKVFGHKKMINDVRPVGNVNKVMPPYAGYDIKKKSMVDNMKAFIEELNITAFKIRQIIINTKPDGLLIDMSSLTDIVIDGDKIFSAKDAVAEYRRYGDLMYQSKKDDGDPNGNALPITERASTIGTNLNALIVYFNQVMENLYDITGINKVRDGSTPNSKSLVGTQKMALAMSNNATKYISDGYITIVKNLSEITLSRIQQIGLMGGDLSTTLKNAIGSSNSKILVELYKLHKHEFVINIEVDMTEEERSSFEQLITISMNGGLIEVPDISDLRAIKNNKLANEALKIKIANRKKVIQEQKEREIQLQEQARAQADIAIQQATMQATQMELQAKQAEAQAQTQKELAILTMKAKYDFEMENLKFQHEMQLKTMEVQSNKELNKFKEDSKDKRTAIQATQQSQMVDQRQRGSMPIDFKTQAEYDEFQKQKNIGEEGMPPIADTQPTGMEGSPMGGAGETIPLGGM